LKEKRKKDLQELAIAKPPEIGFSSGLWWVWKKGKEILSFFFIE
jgi:hypothetical protein